MPKLLFVPLIHAENTQNKLCILNRAHSISLFVKVGDEERRLNNIERFAAGPDVSALTVENQEYDILRVQLWVDSTARFHIAAIKFYTAFLDIRKIFVQRHFFH